MINQLYAVFKTIKIEKTKESLLLFSRLVVYSLLLVVCRNKKHQKIFSDVLKKSFVYIF